MKLPSYAELESTKRAMTLGRIGIIAGAHLLVLGGGYFVTKFGSKLEQGDTALAGANGLVTWSSQDANAQDPTVHDSVAAIADGRASDLSGYNGNSALYAGVASGGSSSSGGRFAPTRPSEVNDRGAPSDASRSSARPSLRDDEVLRPLNNPGSGYNAPDSIAASQEPSGSFEYKVQAGDSLWAIGKRFNASVNEILAANPGMKATIVVGQVIQVPRRSGAGEPSAGAPAAEAAAPQAPANGSLYTVKSGDSLSRIASKQGVTVAELRAANNLTGDMIRVGQQLVIPGVVKKPDLAARQHNGQKVVVEAGDTLEKIATVYGVSVRELQELNGIQNPRAIRAGQTLLIPERAATVAQPASNRPQQRPAASATPTPKPAAPAPQPVQPTLDELTEEPAPDSGALPTLDDAFQADDLEEQPLVEIQE